MYRLFLVKAAYRKQKLRAAVQPLGLMYLSSYIKSKSDKYNIKIFDNRFYDDDLEFIKVLKEFSPQIMGISSTTLESKNMHRIAAISKRLFPDIKIIAGGPHPTQFYEDVLEDRNIDYVVRGEGEEALFNLIEKIRKGENIDKMSGVAYKNGNDIVDGGKAILNININELPMPDYEAIDMERYFKIFSMATIGKRRYVAISTSRGCPFECVYCHNLFGRKFRYMRAERVIEEIDYLVKRYRITDIEFVEDIFNLNRERTERILDMIIDRGYGLRLAFPNGLRSDLLDKDILIKFKKAGTIFISFAIETASFDQQKRIKKRLDLEKANKAIKEAARLGIICNGFFMLGFPGETEEEMRKTIDFALRSNLHTAYFFIVNPFKGTELYEQNRDKIERSTLSNNSEEYSYFLGRFNLSAVSTNDLLKIARNAYLRFYLNPIRIFRIIAAYYRIKSGILALLCYGLKTLQLIGYRTVQGLLNYEDPADKAADAPR